MSCIQDVLNELTDVSEYVKLRDGTPHGRRMVESVASKIATVPCWTTSMSNAVTRHMQRLEFTDDLSAVVTAATDDRLADTHDQQGSPPANSYKSQTIKYLHNFMTADDWSVIDNPKTSSSERDKQFALRLVSLNIRRPREDGAVIWAIANALIVEKNIFSSWPSYRSIYNRVAVWA